MIKTIARWILSDEIKNLTNENILIEQNLTITTVNEKALNKKILFYEELLANKNAKCTQAQSLFVTNHAIQRYKERIGYSGSDEDLRKKIYRLAIRQLSTMDKLEDGSYDIEHNVRARIKDNTVCTITPAPRKYKGR